MIDTGGEGEGRIRGLEEGIIKGHLPRRRQGIKKLQGVVGTG